MSVDWNAVSYHRVSTPHQAWGDAVLGRLSLRGDETVIDAGCGTGRITERLLDRLPHGRVIAVDASPSMAAAAEANLDPERATVICSDLLALELDEPADAAISTATFHWVHDHDALFDRMRAALKPGATFAAQCGGEGNVAGVIAALEAVATREPFRPYLAGRPLPWNYATPERTRERLERAGFDVASCWLEPSPSVHEQPHEFLTTVVCMAQMEWLPEPLRPRLADALVEQLGGPPVTIDYVRLNWVATAR